MTQRRSAAASPATPPGNVPDAELLIASGCVHCPVVLSALAELVKKGLIRRLQVINLTIEPEAGSARGARGVPWIRLGPLVLQGAHTQSELTTLAERAGSTAGLALYLRDALEAGELDTVIAACRRSPEQLLPPLLALAGDLDTPFTVRIGVGAVFEELAPAGLPDALLPALLELAASEHPQVRADAAHFLGLSGWPDARPALAGLAGDSDAAVREIAAESLAVLDGADAPGAD